ncbi:LuxE/PaaK family acyltransferase [Rhodohalobacter sulfatireducens]|uniref:Acyl-protein synthetase LuxE domain-containing protein n=1 Tax=Rhodohalobacter sulfatireducens TaxID=2911366 RepID=A0ABS9KCW2_9BACT|nr:hypothetical protein [Rhodohalobacter sulfatireducens]MCG2588665.1 hypothetical protein [Rhodohalobacter sulfatireducens]
MKNPEKAIELIFDLSIPFEERCSKIFEFQSLFNSIYGRFIEPFGLKPTDKPDPQDIPLFPIRGFKDGRILIETDKEPDLIFKSSGTSNMSRSIHRILSRQIYEKAILEEFKKHFPFNEYIVLFHLPGYDQNPYSSLIWMANYLIKSDPSGSSQFVTRENLDELKFQFQNREKKILLFGAAFGLMDIIESGNFEPVEHLEILETGGMKTHRREMTKPELRHALSDGFDVATDNIHSEYGMCELLSQMYATGGEWFETPHWVQVSIRDPKNPSRICEPGEEGKIGIIDLANIHSCSFILTDDRGVMDHKGRFKVLGRWNPEDLRGCNFLIDHE